MIFSVRNSYLQQSGKSAYSWHAMRPPIFFTLLLCAFLLPCELRGEAICGIVVDPTGARVPHAKVQIRNVETKPISVQTGHDGRFSFKNLGMGDYEVAVTASGFDIARQKIAVTAKSKKCEQPVQIRLAIAIHPGSHVVEPSPITGALRERIPKPDPEKYREIRDGKDWKNPFLVVRPNGIEIIGVTTAEPGIPLRAVTKELERLPSSAWPYGLVVAVVDVGIVSGGDDLPKVHANRRELLVILKRLGIAAELWPSG